MLEKILISVLLLAVTGWACWKAGIMPIPFGMVITKNTEQERINSGNNFMVYFGAAWITLGNLISGSLERASSDVEITHADGYGHTKPTKRMSTFSIVLGQVAKEVMDKVDEILTGYVKAYYDNGFDDFGKGMDIFMPQVKVKEKFKIDMEGGKHQLLAIELSIIAQAANVTATPSTDFPSIAHSIAVATPQTGKNPFYLLQEA